MSHLQPNDADGKLRARLREALATRDRQMPARAFQRMWPGERSRVGDAATGTWRMGLRVATAFAVAGVVAVALWATRAAWPPGSTSTAPSHLASLDHSIAAQLSSSDYWRVPSDRLLALSPPPLAAPLPDATGFDVSLEESVL